MDLPRLLLQRELHASPAVTALLLVLPLLWALALADVQQQYLKTRTVVEDAYADDDWPSAPGSSNDVEDSHTWTNNNANVRLDSSVVIEFNENINVGYGYITFQPPISVLGTSSSAATTIAVPSSDVTVSGRSLYINEGASRTTIFGESTTYVMSLDAGVVEDLGVPADTNAAFSVQLTTGDFTAPTRTSIAPVDDSPAVDIATNIVLTFSEAVQAWNGGAGITVENYYWRQGPPYQLNRPCNDASVVISGTEVTISVDIGGTFPLLPCQRYAMVYSMKCFYDTSPNHNWVQSLPVSADYDFWTSCITGYSPARDSYGIDINSDVVLTFAEDVIVGSGNIVLTPLGEAAQNFDVTDSSKVTFDAATKQVTVIGGTVPTYLCNGLDMQNCKGKPIDVSIAAGVVLRVSTSAPAPASSLDAQLTEQLGGSGSSYRFTLHAADLTPPQITIVSMYGISESVIRVTVRLDESGTTYCRAYASATFNPVSQGGSDVPTMVDCVACVNEIKSDSDPNFVGSSAYDPVRKYAEHEVDVTDLVDKTMYWVYCYSLDDEIPAFNVVTSAQMLATERQVRTLDTTPPTFGTFTCVPTVGLEDSITVTLSMNEPGRAYCKVVNRDFVKPSPNAVIAEGFFADTADTSIFQIDVNQITTGLGATGMESLYRKTDYDVYCWAQDDQGYPYYGPNGMSDVVACPATNPVTTLDLTRPNMRFVMAESISHSQILITVQVDEGARIWCAAWASGDDPALDSGNFETKIKANEADCMDNKGRQCGSFWVYDLDDIEDSVADGVDTIADYNSADTWKFNQDVDIIVFNLIEEQDYAYIYCYAEDDEADGVGGAPNKMMFDAIANAGPNNVHTIKTGIGTIQTLDESPPTFTKLSMLDPTAHNDRIVVTFSLNEAGTSYCRVTRSDSGETTLRINRILTANYGAAVAAPGDTAYITVDKLEERDSMVLYEAAQYDVYCWAKDSAVDTQGQPRPNYMVQDYVDTPVGTTGAHAASSPAGGKTTSVWVKDMTPPQLIYVSSEALTQSTIQITLQLNEPGTVWCQPVLPSADGVYLDKDYIDATNYKSHIIGRSGSALFREFVHNAYINVDVEVNKLEAQDGMSAVPLVKETPYNIYCFAEDDWKIEAENAGSKSVNFNYLTNNVGAANEIAYATSDTFMDRIGLVTTLDLTPPSITITGISSDEASITVTLRLDETGTAWCQAVRHNFNAPTILEILDTNFFNTYTYDPGNQGATTTVTLTGYDRPKNADNSYLTPLVLGTDYDVYCYADDDLCLGCKVTNGVSFAHVVNTETFIRTKDYTRPNMRFVAAESISKEEILITLQVDEGSKVWCAAWKDDPVLDNSNYETTIKNWSPQCQDNKGRQCGTFWVYDLDDLEDTAADGVSTRADYDSTANWKFNQDVDIIVYGLIEEQDYPYIYCYAEDDENDGVGGSPNKMIFDAAANAGPDNVHTMKVEIGTVQTLDESPPSFTKLSMRDPTLYNNMIIVTFQMNEAGTAYCRTTRSDSGETTLRINQILSANYGAEVTVPSDTGYITIDKLESRDPDDMTLYEAAQYDVYCWAKDSAVDTQSQARPNYMIQDYVETAVNNIDAPQGGKTSNVWVKDTTPPTMIYVSSEALTDSKIQVTLQLNEPGTVWCHPVQQGTDPTYIDVDDVTGATYMEYTKGRTATSSFREYVPVPYYNVDVEVDKLDLDTGLSSVLLTKETPYNIFCFAEDDWKIEADNAAIKSVNYQLANTATPNMTVGDGNEVPYDVVVDFKDRIGLVTTLDLTPPSITITAVASTETQITVTLRLDETGTAWCQAVRHGFDVPTILEILDTNFFNTYTYDPLNTAATTTVLLTGYDRPKNADNSYVTPLVLGVDYDVYCYADDDLCLGCKVTNGVSFAHVQDTKEFIRTKDFTRPNMRFVAAESIAHDQILITLQVDEGSRVWCAAWDTDPGMTTLNAEAKIKGNEGDCRDGKGRQCGTFWIYDLDDLEDDPLDGVNSRADFDSSNNWKYNQDVDIIVYGLTEELDYPYIYCFAEDDETPVNTMMYDDTGNAGPDNVHTMKVEIGTIQTLDETPPTFTRLQLQDPTAFNDRLIVTFQLNEAGTAYCRTTRSDSGETTLRINQILTANYGAEVATPSGTGYITVDRLESRDDKNLYEAAQYDVYCWAKDSAVDTQGMVRPNYMVQDYVETLIGSDTLAPLGGKTTNVWIVDVTPPTIIVVSREALAEDTIQVTLQLNEPGTIWCQVVDKDSSATTTTEAGFYCRDMDVKPDPPSPCYFENFIKGTQRAGAGSTVFRADVHIPYQDYDIDLNYIEKVVVTQEGQSLVAQYHYHIWCFAEDDWAIEATNAPSPSPLFDNNLSPNKVVFTHSEAVKDTIGQVLTLDQTAPTWTSISGEQTDESVLSMTMTLDELGTVWCQPVRQNFAEPSINEILQNNEYNTNCGTSPCVVTVQGLQSKTVYDIWCYTEDDNVYPQRPNGRKFTPAQKTTLSTLDRTPPILTIVSAESPIKTDIRVKVKMEEPGTVWCNSWITGTSYGVVTFDAVIAGSYNAFVGLPGQTPGGPIDTNVEVVVTDRQELTQYDTYCTAIDTSTLPSTNKLLDATTVSTMPAIGQITTLDQSPPTFTKLGAKGINENTVMVTFQCNEACRSYCRVTRSDSGETSLSINRILKADYQADWSSGDQTIQLSRLEDDSSLQLLERGTLYDTYCWIRDEAVQHSCHAKDAGAACETFPKPNYQGQVYVDTAFGGTPPWTKVSPAGGKMLHVRTPDTTPPNIIFVEAESTEETSITVTLQLDEPGTAYCGAYTSTQASNPSLFTELTTGATIYKNTVTNWNNIYKNFEVKVNDLSMETKYYVYCAAEDDEVVEGATTIDPQPTQNNQATPILTEATGRFTLDLTPPIITVRSIASMSETTSTVTLRLDEPGTAWCKAVRDRFDMPTINQIIAANFFSITTLANTDFTVRIENMERDTEYDTYCHARDRGTEVEYGVTPNAGNPGNDVTSDHVLTTKRDIHTMGDSSSPIIVSTAPVDAETGVSINPVFQIVFNEDIQAGTGFVTFQPETGAQIPLDVAQVNDGLCASNYAKLRITLSTFTADFSGCTSHFLTGDMRWYVSFAKGVFRDDSHSANDVEAFGASSSYYFKTGTSR